MVAALRNLRSSQAAITSVFPLQNTSQRREIVGENQKFANFPPIFKIINVGRDDIGSLMKSYAEQKGFLSQPRRMLISSYSLENGTLITPLLLFT